MSVVIKGIDHFDVNVTAAAHVYPLAEIECCYKYDNCVLLTPNQCHGLSPGSPSRFSWCFGNLAEE